MPGYSHHTPLAVPTLGFYGPQTSINVHDFQKGKEQLNTSRITEQPDTIRGYPDDGIPFLRHKLTQAGHDQDTISLMMSAWRDSTKNQYSSYIQRWEDYAVKNNCSILNPTLGNVCTFLRTLHEQGLAHGAVNTARSALSLILPKIDLLEIGKQSEVRWIVKSIYEKNPPKPKYNAFWDVSKVFRLFNDWPANQYLSLKHLTWKLNMLLLLVTSQRGQTILHLSVQGMTLTKDLVVFRMNKLLKHNRLGDPLDTIFLQAYNANPKLCVVRTLKAYLVIVGPHRKQMKQLLLSIARPYHEVKRDTIARWTVETLQAAGVDVTKYKAHSTRGASASATRASGANINVIMKHAGWRCEESFARHYNKQIDRERAQTIANDMICQFDK